MPANYAVKSLTYQSKWVYGGEPLDVKGESISAVTAVDDRTVEVVIESFRPHRVYQLVLADALNSSSGETMEFREFHYTANRIPSS